jgi:hypothetical protein
MKNQYFQSVIVKGAARRYILDNRERFELFHCLLSDPDTLFFIGAGEYFSPLIQSDVKCECSEKCTDVFKKLKLSPKVNEPFPKECDLTPIVEFLRLGGLYGYNTPTV